MERFLPDVERTRWQGGWFFVSLGGLAAAALLWRAVAVGRANTTSLVLFAMAGALAAWGLRLILIRDEAVEVDLDKRTYVLTRDGRPAAARALDELGPLVTYVRGREGRSGNEYAVRSSAVSDLAFFVAGTPEKARRHMEDLARRWRLSCQFLDRAVRTAEDLDKPLHERLCGSASADPAPLRPEWRLRIDELKPGYALVSTNRSFAPFTESASILVALVSIFGLGSVVTLPSKLRDTMGEMREMLGDEFGKVLLGLGGVVLVVMAFQIARALRDALFPGTLRVTPDGVCYRRRRLAFDDIEEVMGGPPIEILGDRGKLRLSASFCPAEARGAVVAEIQGLIVAVAPHAPRRG
jgi:hypothetical protein